MSNCDLGTPPSVCIMCRLCSTDSFPPLDSSWSTEAKLCSRPLDSRPSSTSHMPNKGTNHICNQCLSNNQPLQRHLRPSRTSRSCSFLSQFDLCPLITKFAHRLNRMSFSNLLLTFFLYVILLSSQVTCDGIFELRLDEFVNELNRDASGRCCGLNSTIESLTDQRQICEQKCQTFFRVCFKNFQANIEANPKLDDCTFGQTLTPVLGESRISKHIIQFPFNYSWPGTFSLIIEAWNNVSAIAPAEHNKTPNLIGRFFEKRSNKLSVGNKWTHSTSGQNQTTLRFSYRFQCPDQYYGENCANKCTPKDDTWGHYNCDSNGERICHPGWTGDYCNQPICRHCNETNGACIAPGKCKCRMGWEGESCNQCSRHFGCLNGYCGKPWECICYEGWGGLLCNNDLNYCTNNRPCKNGGTCTNTGQGSFTCQCPPGFAGTQCEIVVTIEVDICDSFPCQNGATCKSHSSSNYTCECPLGYHGPNCEQLVNNCSNNPCDNGGTCVDGISGFLCSCKLGYSGKKCQTAQKNCETNPCHHGGICLSNSTQPEGYACQCRAGYKGDHCEININDCESNPCLNGGTCKDEVNTFRCFCVPGFHGDLCEVNVDDCLIKPCANGGLCHDRVNDYMCKCTLGYTGKDCSINIDDCASNPCLNGAYCRDLVNDFECLCAPNFYGPNCEYSNSTLPVSAGSSQEAIEENAFSPNQLVMIIVGSIALPLIAIITLVVFITCKQWKRHNHKMKTRRDEDEARRQNEHNSVMSSLNNKCLDQCLNPSAANVIVNAFDRAPSLHHLNKCLNLNQTKVTNEYVYGRQFDKLNTMQNEYRSMNKVLNTDLSVKLALDDPYSHTYEHIQKPSNLLSTNLSNQQIYQSHSGKQSNLDIYSSPAVTVPLVKSDCPQVMPSRPSDFGHHEQSAKVHSNLQNNIQIAATLQRMGCRSNSIYVIENHYSQPIYDDPKKLQATEV